MPLFRKSLARDLRGRAQRFAGAGTHDRRRELAGATRQYVGKAGLLASQATRQVRRHPRTTAVALGATLGVAALATAWLLARRRIAGIDAYDEHDPTRQRATDASGNALDGSGEDNPVPGDGGFY